MKNYKFWTAIVAYFAGMLVSRIIGYYYGVSTRATFAYVGLAFLILLIIFYLLKKKYLQAVRLFILMLPFSILFIGIFLGNFYLALGGAVSLFIAIPIIKWVTDKYGGNNSYR